MNAPSPDHNPATFLASRLVLYAMQMRHTPRVLILLLVVVNAALLIACTNPPTANSNQPTANSNQPAANANTAPPASSQAKPQQPDTSTTGSIEVTSAPPGARVILIATGDDTASEPQSKGSTPTTITGVRPGKYTVDLEKTGYRFFQRNVEVKAGKAVKINATLKKQ